MPIAIRDGQDGDVPFIFSSWLKSFRTGLFCKHVDNNFYYAGQHKLMEKIVKRSKIIVAVDPHNPADIYGYLCFEHIDGLLVIHYGYTKHTFRCMGVFRQLIKHTNQDFNNVSLYSHSSIMASILAKQYNLVYNPYILVNHMDEVK